MINLTIDDIIYFDIKIDSKDRRYAWHKGLRNVKVSSL